MGLNIFKNKAYKDFNTKLVNIVGEDKIKKVNCKAFDYARCSCCFQHYVYVAASRFGYEGK